jgi:hypothetical protein
MTLATDGEMGFPKRQKRRPFSCCAFAHAANSSGVGMCPISTAHRRTMNPSIILGAPWVEWEEEPTICFSISEIVGGFKKTRLDFSFFGFAATLWAQWPVLIGPDISNFAALAAGTAAAIPWSASPTPMCIES